MYTSITECVNEAGLQLADHPRSHLSRTLHQWALDNEGVDPESGLYPVDLAAHRWITAGFLNPAFLPLDGPYPWANLREDPGAAYLLWVTARRLVGLSEV